MDNESDAVMMLMDLGAYEKMLDSSQGIEKLSEEELLEKINRDVAVWRASNDKERAETYEQVVEEAPRVKSTTPVQASEPEKAVVMEKGKDINLVMAESVHGAAMAGQAEQEQSASDIVAEEDEEKFYLEPVE